jgi:hypothetical protein
MFDEGRRMKITRLVALIALAAGSVMPLSTHAGAAASATLLTLPTPNKGLFEGFLPAFACTSSGNCIAGGAYSDGSNNQQGVLYSELDGTWQAGVPLLAPQGASTPNPAITLYDGACGAAGSCSVLGTFNDHAGNGQALVADQVNGSWTRARALVMPSDALGAQLQVQPRAITCWSAGNCVAVGTYNASTMFTEQGFLATEHSGTWQAAQRVSLPADQGLNPLVALNQVACWGTGSCAAVGSYVDANGVTHAIIVPRAGGTWRPAQVVVLPARSSAYAGATLNEITCSLTFCTAVGSFTTLAGSQQPMALTRNTRGWLPAVQVAMPTIAAANPTPFYWGYAGISCASAGNCSFGGNYLNKSGYHQGFLANEVNGVWQTATTLKLPAGALYAGANGGVIADSCTAVGNCTAAAAFVNASKQYQAMLITETNNVWGSPSIVTLPNNAATVGVNGGIYGLACFATLGCEVSGSYLVSGSTYEGFTARL